MNKETFSDYVMSRCPICNGSDTRHIYSGTDRMLLNFTKERSCRLKLSRCSSCGMLYLSRLNYALEDINELYWKMITNNLSAGSSLENQKKPYLRIEDLERFRRTGRLLEIGCGAGAFLKDVAARGWDVTGIEISKAASVIAHDRYGLNVITADFEKPPLSGDIWRLEKGSFDIIIMWGLIEHLRNPLRALKTVKSLLRKNGMLIIYTPNANSIFHKIARLIHSATFELVKFPMELVIIAMHTMYFTPLTIRGALQVYNFSIKKIEMADIDLDFIFKACGNLWWSNSIFLKFAKCLQKISHINLMNSHMIILAQNGLE